MAYEISSGLLDYQSGKSICGLQVYWASLSSYCANTFLIDLKCTLL
jgi:hypothetical protein